MHSNACGPRGRHQHSHASNGGPRGRHGGPRGHHPGKLGGPMGAFGIRRPLRMLSHRLGLDESQTAVLAEFLDDLRTEQAQAEVDKRRASKLLAEAMAGESFDSEAATKATKLRALASERVIEHTAKGLKALHAVLDAEQRQRFVTLMRTGPFTF